MRSFLLIAFQALILLASSLQSPLAQRFWPDVVDTMCVEAERPTVAERLELRSGFATIIPLGMEVPAGRDLSDLLDRVPGIHIHHYGGLGSFSLASIRGSAPGQVTICLDGVPISASGDGFINLALLPVSHLAHAEIYRGPQTQSFGGPPAAGVINLVTPADLQVPFQLAVGTGNFDTRSLLGQWGGKMGSFNTLLSGRYRRSEGDFEFLYGNGTMLNPDDDSIEKRRNNDFEESSILWKSSTGHRRKVLVSYTARLTKRDNGVPGHKNLSTEHVRYRTEQYRHQTDLHYRPRLPLSRLLSRSLSLWFNLSAHLERVRDRYSNLDGEIGLGKAKTDDRTKEEGFRFALSTPSLPFRQEPRIFFEVRTERWTPTDLLKNVTGFTRTRKHRTFALEDRIVMGRWTLEASYRWARAADNYGGPVVWGRPPEAAPNRVHRYEGPVYGLRFDLGRDLAAKANRGRVIRFPTFPELFGSNGLQDGNPELRPENGLQWDAGLAYLPDRPLRLECAYFERLVDDQIYLLQNSQRTVKAGNLDRAWVRGVESSAYQAIRLPGRIHLEILANHTWQEAIDVGHSRTYHNKRIPNLPRNEEYLSAFFHRGGWGLRWEVSARSSSFWHRYNKPEQKTPAYTIHDLTIERVFGSGQWKIRAIANNVMDERVEDIDGYPLPGRHFFVEAVITP